MWRRTPPIGGLPSIGGPPATPATRSVGGSASASRRCWDQGGRRLAQDPSPCRLDVHPDGHCLQPDAIAQAGGGRGAAMPGICGGMAKIGKIAPPTCSMTGFRQPVHERRIKIPWIALQALIFFRTLLRRRLLHLGKLCKRQGSMAVV